MPLTTNPGINYSGLLSPQVNRDNEKKIRYGVISAHEVLQSWADSSEPQYSNRCPYCGNEPKSGNDIHNMQRCPSCYKALDDDVFMDEEIIGYTLNDGEYIAEIDSYNDIFIIKSPYYTFAQFCSPCAPGACHLSSPLESPIEDNKCYCFGHDWFNNGKAPYTVYSVKTGEKIEPEKQ